MYGSRNHFLNLLLICLIGGTLLLLVLSGLRTFDPEPAGQVVWQSDSVELRAYAGSTETLWYSTPLPADRFALELRARHESGDRDAAFGLILGQEDGEVVVAVSPLGYVAIWKQNALHSLESAEFLLPWQTWPHVNPDDQENEFQIDAHGDEITVRLNHEQLWVGSGFSPIDRAGLIVKSFGTGTEVGFGEAVLFAQAGY